MKVTKIEKPARTKEEEKPKKAKKLKKAKRCPFCDRKGLAVIYWRFDSWAQVECMNCGACGPKEKDEWWAVEGWNTRWT